jgi:hypothetical protein
MSEPLKIALTAVTGVLIFVLGQIIQRWFIEPIQDQRKVVGKIAYALTFYANAGTKVHIQLTSGIPSDGEKFMDHIRGLAADLMATRRTIPLYGVMSWVFWWYVLPYKNVKLASAWLVGWSNQIVAGESSHEQRDQIARLLKIDIY